MINLLYKFGNLFCTFYWLQLAISQNACTTRSIQRKKESRGSYSQIFFKLALGGGALNMWRDTHCATCQELVILKSYLASCTNVTCFYFNLEIILNRFWQRYWNAPSANLKKSYFSGTLIYLSYIDLKWIFII